MLNSYKLFKHKSLLTGSTHTLDNKQMISLMLVLRTNGLFLIFYKISVSRCKTLLYILVEYTSSSNIYQWRQHIHKNFKLLNSTDLQSHHQLIQDSPTPLLPHYPHPPPANPPTCATDINNYFGELPYKCTERTLWVHMHDGRYESFATMILYS